MPLPLLQSMRNLGKRKEKVQNFTFEHLRDAKSM